MRKKNAIDFNYTVSQEIVHINNKTVRTKNLTRSCHTTEIKRIGLLFIVRANTHAAKYL